MYYQEKGHSLSCPADGGWVWVCVCEGKKEGDWVSAHVHVLAIWYPSIWVLFRTAPFPSPCLALHSHHISSWFLFSLFICSALFFLSSSIFTSPQYSPLLSATLLSSIFLSPASPLLCSATPQISPYFPSFCQITSFCIFSKTSLIRRFTSFQFIILYKTLFTWFTKHRVCVFL